MALRGFIGAGRGSVQDNGNFTKCARGEVFRGAHIAVLLALALGFMVRTRSHIFEGIIRCLWETDEMGTTIQISSLAETRDYCKERGEKWGGILEYIDKSLIEARDLKGVPIYLTKGRIKNPDSAYLKFKRKRRSDPDQITDWIGCRVLCLFQQDLGPTFDYIVDTVLNRQQSTTESSIVKYFSLKEITIFNWPKDKSGILLQQLQRKLDCDEEKTIKPVPDGLDVAYTHRITNGTEKIVSFKVRTESRESRYQSIHFVAICECEDGEPVSCEIQLRTLLQDVWSELEHALSYKKGKIHPHISKSFELLSRELEAKDILVSQLREIRDQETAFVRYSSASAGPSRWMGYPKDFWAPRKTSPRAHLVKLPLS